MELTKSIASFTIGETHVSVEQDAAAMGQKSARLAADRMKTAVREGKRPALWLMAAPSGFAFYEAFVDLCRRDAELAEICESASYFQFDDYPVARKDPRFRITFRHLLETKFFMPLAAVCGRLPLVHLLEVGSDDDEKTCSEYLERLLRAAGDPSVALIQLKGIGMDGHWGFHGSETPLDHPPAILKVKMNKANIHQQQLDWPDLFPTPKDVPKYAYTCDVQLFLKADTIIDNVPQASKAYSALAAYGDETVLSDIPSSAVKAHRDSHAFLTADSASALLRLRALRSKDFSAVLDEPTAAALERLWDSDDIAEREANVAAMRRVLAELGFI